MHKLAFVEYDVTHTVAYHRNEDESEGLKV